MGLFDKLNANDLLDKAKSAASSASQMAKDKAGVLSASYEQKKEEKAIADRDASEKADKASAEIINAVLSYENNGTLFKSIDLETLKNFSKDFYDKLILPASSVNTTRITMYPFISQKLIERFSRDVPMFSSVETPLVHIKADGKQELMLTEKAFYFVLNKSGSDRFLSRGRIPAEQISEISFDIGEDNATSTVKCDEYVLAEFVTNNGLRQDFIGLKEYFKRIKEENFEITSAQVDALIKEKIGNKICDELKKYMNFEDEEFVYFAWGLSSLSAKDYIVCTSSQIIVMDREMLGATANVKQFYYEDITSANTIQNSKNNNLTGFLIDTAITAATKTCDLEISVAGAKMKIATLYKVEAERVVQVYHEFRKGKKKAESTPQVIVQQQAESPIEQLKKLSELKDLGIISEEEFNTKKTELLAKI